MVEKEHEKLASFEHKGINCGYFYGNQSETSFQSKCIDLNFIQASNMNLDSHPQSQRNSNTKANPPIQIKKDIIFGEDSQDQVAI